MARLLQRETCFYMSIRSDISHIRESSPMSEARIPDMSVQF